MVGNEVSVAWLRGILLLPALQQSVIPSAARDLVRLCPDRCYYVYILASDSRVLYTGVTNDLQRRVYRHKTGMLPGFTKRYSVTRLVYFEMTTDVRSALEREKQLKAWRRSKKVELIEAENPLWSDLTQEWDWRPEG